MDTSRTPSGAKRWLGVFALVVAALIVTAAAPGAGEKTAWVHQDDDGTVTFELDGGDVLITTGGVGTLSRSSCLAGRFCVWSDSYYEGTLWQYSATNTIITLPAAGIGSYWNRRSHTGTLYESTGAFGRTYCMWPDWKNTNIAGWQAGSGSVILSSSGTAC